ncbi:hypothetical protein BBO_01583 [Beauveria brongniartii RCEF 3172]|uniref:Uncharacterized protein n=1 Tax=Beauveria brongniartii RCEF 3172 TaxID=1081107 RepID=A0A162JW55_9HYPO|nr:hypothetical protein BBO_01583 [Beauveria brongniartii RCEF 3172]
MSTITPQSTPINSKPIAATTKTTTHSRPLFAAPSRKTMSVTQTYYLAHKARAKLSREAAQSDHDLRLLVGHANLLDSLMAELAEAEREQERWFNQSVRNTTTTTTTTTKSSEKRHIQWADRIVEEAVEEDEYEAASSDSEDSDSDFDYEEEDAKMTTVPTVTVEQVDAEEDDEEDYAQLELVRTPSHTNSPPELLLDHQDSDSSDDESMPPSPTEAHLPEAAHAKEQEEEEYYSRRNAAGLVSAIMVY